MGQIAYILLCHKNVDAVIEQVEQLSTAGDAVAIHFDANAPSQDFARLTRALSHNPRVVFPRRRVRCGWGEWSLVAATLATVEAALDAFPRATHFYLLSGDCMPIKTSEYMHRFLQERDKDFIECYDFFESDWIKTGPKEERLIYRHWFNERTQPRLFYASLFAQQRLGLGRKLPKGITMQIGSQWWCLRRRSIEAILDLIQERPSIVRFFRTTWIPDETFFQTLVRHLVPVAEIENRSPTFLMFTDYGMPVTFYNDHYDLLLAQNYLFARKISAQAQDLKDRLGHLYSQTDLTFQTANDGPQLFSFLSGRGRVGQRFAPRFWEAGSTIGRDRTVLIVACKKWHIAKRLRDLVSDKCDIASVAYLFDEDDTLLGDLGGIQSTLDKRRRHCRATVRLLLDACDRDHILICVDPSNLSLLQDLFADRSQTRLLNIDCTYSDDYLKGHAMRLGLANSQTSGETYRALMPSLRNGISRESAEIHDQNFPRSYQMNENATVEENSQNLADFLGIPLRKAQDILKAGPLFSD